MSGTLTLVFGPMFSGKTTRLIETYEKHKDQCIVINHSGDNRYSETHVSNHDQRMIPCIKVQTLMTLFDNINTRTYFDHHNTVLIDEGQFFDDLIPFVLKLVEEKNIHVHVFGLDCDFERKKFGHILDLIPYADTIEKLKANCNGCGSQRSAMFSHRVTSEKEVVVIGNNNYIPLCRNCYIKTT